MLDLKDIARRASKELWNDGRLETIDELYASDYVNHTPGPGMDTGRRGLKDLVGVYRSAFPDATARHETIFAEGDRVCIMWTAAGTHRGDFMGTPPTGNRIRHDGITVYRIQDGKVAEEWSHSDFLGLMQQIGAIPEAAMPAGAGAPR